MSKLHTMEKLVLRVLESIPAARSDDYVLMWYVCNELKPETSEMPFGYVLCHHKALGLPNWETVTRCRRKIQAKRPDLVSPETARKRHDEIEVYKEYAKS